MLCTELLHGGTESEDATDLRLQLPSNRSPYRGRRTLGHLREANWRLCSSPEEKQRAQATWDAWFEYCAAGCGHGDGCTR
jgi:hypothetical protein